MPRQPQGAVRRRASVGVLAAVTCLLTTLATLTVGPQGSATGVIAPVSVKKDATTEVVPADAPTTFRIGSLNLLGHGHTAPGGNKPGWASGPTRLKWSMRAIERDGLSVVGLQELEVPQFNAFKNSLNSDGTYGWYPGLSEGKKALANTIIWRRDTWRLVEKHLLVVPYFHGAAKPMPYVKLRNVKTGAVIWVYNSHNPASVRGPAKKWRDIGFKKEAALVNTLRAAEPNVPVFLTGDKNDKTNYFCQVAKRTSLVAPNSAGVLNNKCYTRDLRIDWVLGTPDVTFPTYIARRDALIKKATDHPLIVADALLPSQKLVDAGIDNVVIIDVEGLTRRAALRAAPGTRLRSLIDEGSSTMNARTDPDTVDRLANVVSMLSGRPADLAHGGTGLHRGRNTSSTTTHSSAGEYVSTVFDRAHNWGKSTAFFATFPEAQTVVTSYDSTNGGLDPFGYNNGQNKLDTAVVSARDGQTTQAFVDTLAAKPVNLSYVHLGLLSKTGLAEGFGSKAYAEALALTDRRLARILNAIRKNSEMSGRTLVVLTADRGNTRVTDPTKSATDQAVAYRVPLIVWGPGVEAGEELYDLNLGFTKPGRSQVSATGPQPIRLGAIANMVNKMMAQPALPGSTIDTSQSLTVLAP